MTPMRHAQIKSIEQRARLRPAVTRIMKTDPTISLGDLAERVRAELHEGTAATISSIYHKVRRGEL